jgi:heterodisulfide reductase subunit A
MTDQANTEIKTIEVAKEVLVLGGGIAGLETAKAIADQGYPVVVAESGEAIGAGAETLPLIGMQPAQLDAMVEQAKASEQIEILSSTQFAGAAGMPGNFKVWLATREEVT